MINGTYLPTYTLVTPRREQASRVAVISVICVICRALPCCMQYGVMLSCANVLCCAALCFALLCCGVLWRAVACCRSAVSSVLLLLLCFCRVDVAEGEERRNLVFEYNIAEDTIYGVPEETTSVRREHEVGHSCARTLHSRICARVLSLLRIRSATRTADEATTGCGRRGRQGRLPPRSRCGSSVRPSRSRSKRRHRRKTRRGATKASCDALNEDTRVAPKSAQDGARSDNCRRAHHSERPPRAAHRALAAGTWREAKTRT